MIHTRYVDLQCCRCRVACNFHFKYQKVLWDWFESLIRSKSQKRLIAMMVQMYDVVGAYKRRGWRGWGLFAVLYPL